MRCCRASRLRDRPVAEHEDERGHGDDQDLEPDRWAGQADEGGSATARAAADRASAMVTQFSQAKLPDSTSHSWVTDHRDGGPPRDRLRGEQQHGQQELRHMVGGHLRPGAAAWADGGRTSSAGPASAGSRGGSTDRSGPASSWSPRILISPAPNSTRNSTQRSNHITSTGGAVRRCRGRPRARPASSSSDSQPKPYQVCPTFTIDRYIAHSAAHITIAAQSGTASAAPAATAAASSAPHHAQREEPVGVVQLEDRRRVAERHPRHERRDRQHAAGPDERTEMPRRGDEGDQVKDGQHPLVDQPAEPVAGIREPFHPPMGSTPAVRPAGWRAASRGCRRSPARRTARGHRKRRPGGGTPKGRCGHRPFGTLVSGSLAGSHDPVKTDAGRERTLPLPAHLQGTDAAATGNRSAVRAAGPAPAALFPPGARGAVTAFR